MQRKIQAVPHIVSLLYPVRPAIRALVLSQLMIDG